MKHKMILVLLTATFLTGCMSTAPIETTSEETITEVFLETTTEPTEEETTTEATILGIYNWIIEDQSPEEVVDTCFFIFDSSVQIIGKTVPECFEYLGHESIDDIFPLCHFVSNVGIQGLELDSINSIYYQTAQIQMDNTISISDNDAENFTYFEWKGEDGTLYSGYTGDAPIWYWTTVSLYIKDYEKAVAIYDLMLQSGNYANNIVSDERTGTEWIATSTNPQSEYEAATMTKVDINSESCYYCLTFKYVEIL